MPVHRPQTPLGCAEWAENPSPLVLPWLVLRCTRQAGGLRTSAVHRDVRAPAQVDSWAGQTVSGDHLPIDMELSRVRRTGHAALPVRPVSLAVNNVGNDGPQLLEEVLAA